MFEGYSTNLDIATNQAIPFNNVTIQKGCTATIASPSTIQLNKCGVYMVNCDAVVTSTDAATATMQLYKSGVVQPQGQASATVTADAIRSISFVTFVQVPTNYSPCNCCSSPTTIQIINTEDPITYNHINICISKIC